MYKNQEVATRFSANSAVSQDQNKMTRGQNKMTHKKDPRVDFKTVDARIKPLPGIELKPDVEIQPDTTGWLTRQQSAEFLSVSVTTIANYERAKKLNPRHEYRADSRGIEQRVTVYDPKQLLPLRRYAPPTREKIRDPGELAASCFELFDQGRTLREIVVILRETPGQIVELHESWLNAGGAAFTITPTAKECFETIVGPFSSVTELLSLVEDLAKKEKLVPAQS